MTEAGGQTVHICLDLFLTFARIGAFTFGGGYAMIPLIEHEAAEKKGWITAEELTDIIVVAESTPGPIAINCATFTGQRIAGLKGAAAATMGMVLPSFVIILLISYFLEDLLAYPAVEGAFRGIRAAVALIIIRAAVRMLRKQLKTTPDKRWDVVVAAIFFSVVFTLNLLGARFSTIWLILIAGIAGMAMNAVCRRGGGER